MSALQSEVRPGAYADSIVLMQLQASLASLDGVEDAGVVMGTAANRELLAASGLLPPGLDARADDLVIVVRAASEASASAALARVDELMTRRAAETDDEFRPRSLASAVKLLPEARWVLVSVPGRHAAAVGRQALELGRNVFLYSDNVTLDDEVELKRRAAERGLLVMGPDCGTALVAGTGLGFANRVRRGAVGIVAASGTGLQAVASRIHALGQGVSHALGTGGRDLSAAVGGATARQALALLGADSRTKVIVLVSKPPAAAVAARLLAAARATSKPVVVYFQGLPRPAQESGQLFFMPGLSEAATVAASLARKLSGEPSGAAGSADQAAGDARGAASPPTGPDPNTPSERRFLRALFAGGTLALEAQRALGVVAGPLFSNVPILGAEALAEVATSRGHSILDLGADEFTVGRLHPMIDPELRLRRLRQEIADPATGLLLLDVVLGYGSHPDPAASLAPVLEEARGRGIEVVVLIVGTDEDPQDLAAQRERLETAGATVFDGISEGLAHVASWLAAAAPVEEPPRLEPGALAAPLAAINVGLEAFHDSLAAQGARSVHVEWRPPAGGDERLQSLLARLGGSS